MDPEKVIGRDCAWLLRLRGKARAAKRLALPSPLVGEGGAKRRERGVRRAAILPSPCFAARSCPSPTRGGGKTLLRYAQVTSVPPAQTEACAPPPTAASPPPDSLLSPAHTRAASPGVRRSSRASAAPGGMASGRSAPCRKR